VIVVETRTKRPPDRDAAASTDWWRTAVVYQVYVRSFADADGDGLGDLRGLLKRFDHLADLGVDAIWLNPFYPSPLRDGGYDIVDHQAVDQHLGTLADFDELVAHAHERDIKVIVDVVPNHTSDEHPWFRAALAAGPGSAARDRYIFRDGIGDAPPSDWRSHFGGSAWERVADGQWYCHLFSNDQPDLNWTNPEVRDYFRDTLRFWADRGVDGFRIDVAHSLAKDLSEPLRSQPHLDTRLPLDGSDPLYDREEVHIIYREWRHVFDEYDPPRMAVAETWYPTNDRTYLYARPTELGQVFDFSLLKTPWKRDALHLVIERSLHHQRATGGGLTWVLSSHDVPRHASRLALAADVDLDAWLVSGGTAPQIDPAVARRRARAAALMMLALPGSAYLFQGEELGLLEVADLDAAALQDPIWQRTAGRQKGRDGCRVPLPWARTGPSFGFGPGGAWLPQPPSFGEQSVEAQDGEPDSTLTLYRAALRLRRRHQEADDELTWCSDDHRLLHFSRSNGWQCLVNFGAEPVALPRGRVLLTTAPLDVDGLPTDAAAWIR
jgi:alpha-glucosidase